MQNLLNIINDLEYKLTISIIFNVIFLIKIVAVYWKKYNTIKPKN